MTHLENGFEVMGVLDEIKMLAASLHCVEHMLQIVDNSRDQMSYYELSCLIGLLSNSLNEQTDRLVEKLSA